VQRAHHQRRGAARYYCGKVVRKDFQKNWNPPMVKSTLFFFLMLTLGAVTLLPDTATAEIYELRTYTTHKDKLKDLNARFRNHTVALFKKHGMESVGYWTPTDGPTSKNTLIYVLKHKSRDAAAKSWAAFLADPEWKKVAKESRKDGPVLAKAPASVYMTAAAYTPDFKGASTAGEQVYELRTYRTNPGKLPLLDTRFKDNTIRIFERHGIKSVAYWHPADKPASRDTLIYIIQHASSDAAKKSWKAFREDPEWHKVAKESQKDGAFLRERPESVYMKSTDYSAIK